ncbi:MAG: tetratricopeptide repeat protein [Paracoccaceae bacterium]
MPRPQLRLAVLTFGAALASLGANLAWADTLTAATTVSAPAAPEAAGAYLAARLAAKSFDFIAAATWYDRALEADPKNPTLLEGAATAYLALGNISVAGDRARLLVATGAKSQIAFLAILAADARAGDFASILKNEAAGNTIGTLVDNLVVAWAEVGTGKMSEALAEFDAIIKTPGMAAFGTYHKALALASTGDFEGADALLSGPAADAVSQLRRGLITRVEVLSQLERDADAVALIDKTSGTQMDDGIADLRRRLVAGETLPFDGARSATDGLAEVFFTLATALSDQADDTYILFYTRVAAALRPDHVEAQLMSARILEKLNQYDLASAAFATVPPTDSAYVTAMIGQAQSAISANRLDDAVKLLQTLATARPLDIEAQVAVGDALHQQEHCDLAIPAYDAAIAALGKPEKDNWPLFYKRANCQLTAGNWPAAEADYRLALTLDPTEPRLLNELGYSYVDRGEHLDEALKMIQQAVAESPNTGYIVDSLAWAYFRLGRYADAVVPMEKASLLMPVDPVVTDHLGDVYWAVDRKREAQFQWHRALSYKPEDKDATRIQRKLDVGLDQVLQEEKAAPIAASGTNGD